MYAFCGNAVPLEPVQAADGTVIDYMHGDRVQMFAFDRVRTRYDPALVNAYARRWSDTSFQQNIRVLQAPTTNDMATVIATMRSTLRYCFMSISIERLQGWE